MENGFEFDKATVLCVPYDVFRGEEEGEEEGEEREDFFFDLVRGGSVRSLVSLVHDAHDACDGVDRLLASPSPARIFA